MSLARVLLVDDDPDIRFIAELSLGRVGGFEVVVAGSGAEALACLGTARPEVVLLDMVMPDMDGAAVLRALRTDPAWVDLPVIFLTGKTQDHELQTSLALGAIGLIEKPFDPMTLPALVREIWASRTDG